MVRHQYPIEAVLNGEPRVFARVNSLDEELPFPEFAHAIGEGPVHGGVQDRHAVHVDAVVHGEFVHIRERLAIVAGRALRQVLGASAQVGFAVAAGGVIHGEGDHRASGRFHSLQELFACFPGARRVDLIPHRPAQSLVDVFHSGGGSRRQKL